jgi:hypothetical protein
METQQEGNKQESPFYETMKFGLVAVSSMEVNRGGIVHFVGFNNPPTAADMLHWLTEISTDKHFGPINLNTVEARAATDKEITDFRQIMKDRAEGKEHPVYDVRNDQGHASTDPAPSL